MSWLNNVPEHRTKHTHAIDTSRLEEVQDLLGFVQRTQQPAAQLDHLMEEVLNWYLKRTREDFPTPGQLTKLSFSVPESLDARLKSLVEARRKSGDDSAQPTHVVIHALELFLGSHGGLLKAWREDVKLRQEATALPEPAQEHASKEAAHTSNRQNASYLQDPNGVAHTPDDVRGRKLGETVNQEASTASRMPHASKSDETKSQTAGETRDTL